MNILLVEDDAYLSGYLATELRTSGHDVTTAHDGHVALQLVLDHQFEAVVLDRILPQVDGLTVVRRLRADGITIPVVMLTALGQLCDRVDGLDGGADDYIVKPVDVDELHARLNALVRGRSWTISDNDTVSAKEIIISPKRLRAWYREVALDLPKMEFILLSELVRNADTVLTRKMLCERLWSVDLEPQSKFVDSYVSRLRRRIIAQVGDDPIVTVRGLGYMVRA